MHQTCTRLVGVACEHDMIEFISLELYEHCDIRQSEASNVN